MGLSVRKLLETYFDKYDLQDVLDKIDEKVSGNNNELINRIIKNWEQHGYDNYELFEFLERPVLARICEAYRLDSQGSKDVLIRRIKKEKLLDADSPKPSSMGDDRLFMNKKVFEKMGLVDSDSKKVNDSKQNSVTKDGPKDSEKSSSHHRISLSKITAICIIIGTIIAVLSYVGLKPH
jgi:hypothetical protein